MANPEHLDSIRKGSAYWNNSFIVNADLSHADLRNANLKGIALCHANLIGVNLTGANLSHADLTQSDLAHSVLSDSILIGANFSDANLTHACLNNANCIDVSFIGTDLTHVTLFHSILRGVTFSDANLFGTNFDQAWVGATSFTNLDLQYAKGLETMKHLGPSSIGIDTLYLSQGKIPQPFLRGAGVSEDLATYIDSLLIEKPPQFHSCFISFTSTDKPFADKLHIDLQRAKVPCWYAPYDVKSGIKLHEQLLEAIRIHDKLLLILSENSIDSEWVRTEIREALHEEQRSGKRKLFPIALIDYSALQGWRCMDGDTGKDLAREIREYYIPDFSQWADPDAYQYALAMLLRDLSAVG
ncbi:MAG: toll/interleukin-1 receptor domain-containing protein [Chloroflexota bacterium]